MAKGKKYRSDQSGKKRNDKHKSQPVVYLPKSVREQLPKTPSGTVRDHLGLWLSKYISWEQDKDGKVKVSRTFQRRLTHDGNETAGSKKSGKSSFQRRSPHNGTLHLEGNAAKIAEAALQRQRALLRKLQQQGYHTYAFELVTASRMVVGLGIESVLETNLRLHHTYGIPIIPGSALKGLARSVARRSIDTSNPIFQTAFGEPKQAGSVIFFDALPLPQLNNHNLSLKLQLDVMNVHFPDYYTGQRFPTEWQNPNPIFFLTVAPETAFLFSLAVPPDRDRQTLSQVAQWLQQGLTTMGIGAKTSAGYGFFRTVA